MMESGAGCYDVVCSLFLRAALTGCCESHTQWWILGEANEAVASGPPSILRAPASKTAYTVLDSLQMFAQRTIWSEDLFFFLENTLILGEKYASPDQTSFFSQTTSIFENSCLRPLNWNIHHWPYPTYTLSKAINQRHCGGDEALSRMAWVGTFPMTWF